MSESFDIYTLLFLVLAVVVFIRLRSVLGRRTGNERPPYDPFTRSQPKPGAPEEGNVVALPRSGSGPAPVAEAAGPSAEDLEERLGRYAPKDSPLRKSLSEVIRVDPDFEPGQFLDGSKMAYEMIVAAFADGDKATLKNLLGPEVLQGFERAIAEREERGETVDSTLIGIDKADLIEAEVKNKSTYLTVKFVSELISVTHAADGEVVEGSAKTVREVTDIWTFAREYASRNPNWRLVATESAN